MAEPAPIIDGVSRIVSLFLAILLAAGGSANENGPRIAFATLWQGVVTGEIPVEVLAGPEVARIDLHLDAELVATLPRAPWRTTCELGSEIAPHELIAHAYDSEGELVGEARQRLNLPRPNAEIEILVTGSHVSLAWGATAGDQPKTIRASLDGVQIEVAPDARTFTLPPYEPQRPHVLRVEADFGNGLAASREMAIGDVLSADSQVELTGLLVKAPRRGEELQVSARGEPARVVALEEGPAEVFAVVDPGAAAGLATVSVRSGARTVSPMRAIPTISGTRVNTSLGRDHRLHLVTPAVVRVGGRYELFPTSNEIVPDPWGILGHLIVAARSVPIEVPRLADAVAIAALSSGERGRRRVVLLILDSDGADASAYSAAAVRRYVQRLRVPLVVWTSGKATDAMRANWGQVTEVNSPARIERATRELRALLTAQRIAWIEGAYLPHELSVEGLTIEPEWTEEEEEEEVADELGIEGALLAESSVAVAGAPEAPPLLKQRVFGPFGGSTDVANERLLQHLERVATALPGAFATRFGLQAIASGSIFVFGRERDFRTWLKTQHGVEDARVEGFAASGTASLYLGHHGVEDVSAMLVHEVTHLLARNAFRRSLPPWLEEGLADELAFNRFTRDGKIVHDSVRISRSARMQSMFPTRRGTRFSSTVSGPGVALLRLSRGSLVPLPELLNASQDDFLASAGRQDRYATAAFFVRFLLSAQPERAQRFRAFLAAGVGGAPMDAAAFEVAMGETVVELDKKYLRWVRQLAMTPR